MLFDWRIHRRRPIITLFQSVLVYIHVSVFMRTSFPLTPPGVFNFLRMEELWLPGRISRVLKVGKMYLYSSLFVGVDYRYDRYKLV